MNSLHKRKEVASTPLEPHEGERILLCSNESNFRSPSLGLHEPELTTQEAQALDELARILVDYYLELQHLEQTDPQQFSDILSRFDQGAS